MAADRHRAEPRTLRYRLLHTAARITRGQHKVFLRVAEDWSWPSPDHSGAYGRSRSRPDSRHHGYHASPPAGPRRHRTQRRSSALPSPEPTFQDHPRSSRSAC